MTNLSAQGLGICQTWFKSGVYASLIEISAILLFHAQKASVADHRLAADTSSNEKAIPSCATIFQTVIW